MVRSESEGKDRELGVGMAVAMAPPPLSPLPSAKLQDIRVATTWEVSHEFEDGMGGYLYVIDGELTVNGEEMTTGDAAKIGDEPASPVPADRSFQANLTS